MSVFIENIIAGKDGIVLPAWLESSLSGVLGFLLDIICSVIVLIIVIKMVNWVVKLLGKAL